METKEQILANIEKIKGDVAFSYKNLVTGEAYSYNEDYPFQAASIIKFPILTVMHRFLQDGEILLRDEIRVSESEKVPGCGALYLFPGDLSAPIEALLNTMIAISDNTSTNAIINMFGIDSFNEEFKKLGLETTKIYRLLFDSEASARGLENLFTCREMCKLLEDIYNGTLLNAEHSKAVIDTLLKQQINHKIPSRIPNAKIAHKTGEDDGISHDIGIVYAKRPFIVTFASNNTDVFEFENFIRNTAFALYEQDNG